MKWIKIKRNEYYYTAEESMLEMKSCLPIVLYDEIDNVYDIATKDEDICDITGYNFSHYLPIKFELDCDKHDLSTLIINR